MELCALLLVIFVLLWLFLMCKSKSKNTVEGMTAILEDAADKADARARMSNIQREHLLDDFISILKEKGVTVRREPCPHYDHPEHPENHGHPIHSSETRSEGSHSKEHFRWFSRPWRSRNWWRYPYFYNSPYVYYPYWY